MYLDTPQVASKTWSTTKKTVLVNGVKKTVASPIPIALNAVNKAIIHLK
jgi:hypothetical protein